jgi:hypothetical protein
MADCLRLITWFQTEVTFVGILVVADLGLAVYGGHIRYQLLELKQKGDFTRCERALFRNEVNAVCLSMPVA